MSSIFISHSHEDKKFVNKLAKDLREEGYYVWIDDAEIKIGDSLIEKIREGIDKVAYVGAVISNNSINSEWVKRELDIAMNQEIEGKKVRVLPILLDDVCIPGFLVGKKYADFRKEDLYEDSLDEIKMRLDEIPKSDKNLTQKQASIFAKRLEILKKELSTSKKEKNLLLRRLEIERREVNPKLEKCIENEQKSFPELIDINKNYAFDIGGTPVTAGYILHALRKEKIKGGPHQIVLYAEINNKADELSLLVEATLRRIKNISDN